MAPPEAPATVQFRTVGAAAAITSGEAAPEMEARPGSDGRAQPRERCPGKGGAKRAAGAYASDFYAGPVLPEGAHRGVQYRVEEPSGGAATCARGRGRALYTTPALRRGCTDFGGASGDHGGPGPMRASLFNIVFPDYIPHTHTSFVRCCKLM